MVKSVVVTGLGWNERRMACTIDVILRTNTIPYELGIIILRTVWSTDQFIVFRFFF